jgi:gliding motility-associated protein GldM
MSVVDKQLNATVDGLDKLLEDDSKAKFRPIQPAITEVRAITTEFNNYVGDLRDRLIDASGDNNGEVDAGDFKEGYEGQLPFIKGKKNKDVTTRLMVDGQDIPKPLGEELKEKILDIRARLITAYRGLIENEENAKAFGLSASQVEGLVQSVAQEMPFDIDDETWKEASDKNSWREFKFYHMPVAAVLPLLSQMQSDLKVSEANMVNNMAQLAGGKVVEFDSFFPVVAADKSYVVGGESIKAKISVGTYSTSLDPANVKITAGGRSLSMNDQGFAELTIPASGSGQKTIPLTVEVTNPLTGEVTPGKGEFTYEVGSRSVAVSADKMNVFYIGVNNPISISASGVSSNDVRVSATGPITISGTGASRMVTASGPGDAKINVSANGSNLGSFDFRVKRIPDPFPQVGSSRGGNIGNGEFKAQDGVLAILENFDFEARCAISGFELVYVPKREDPIVSNNGGAVYNDQSRRLRDRARPGDSYYLNNIRAKCPGDAVTRKIGTMAFTIK